MTSVTEKQKMTQLHTYRVDYIQDGFALAYQFQAEDADHAAEQFQSAEPGLSWTGICRID